MAKIEIRIKEITLGIKDGEQKVLLKPDGLATPLLCDFAQVKQALSMEGINDVEVMKRFDELRDGKLAIVLEVEKAALLASHKPEIFDKQVIEVSA